MSPYGADGVSRTGVVTGDDESTTIGALAGVAVSLLIAATDAVRVGVRLDQVDIVVVSSASGTNRGTDVILTTLIAVRERVLGAINHSGDLNISIAGGKVSGLDESTGEDLGAGGLGIKVGAESDGPVLVLSLNG